VGRPAARPRPSRGAGAPPGSAWWLVLAVTQGAALADGQRPLSSRRHRHGTPLVMVTAPAGPPAHLHAARPSNVPRRSPRPHALSTTGRPRRDRPRPWSHDVLRAGLAGPQPRLCDNTACTNDASCCSASSATRAAFCRRGMCAQPCTPPVLVDVAALPDRARRQEASVQTGSVHGGRRLPSPPCLLRCQVAQPEDGWCHGGGMPGSALILAQQAPTRIVRPSKALRRSPPPRAPRVLRGVVSGTRVRDVATCSGHRGTPLPHPSASHVQPARWPGALRSRALARTPDGA
jgi:hypothetical protein